MKNIFSVIFLAVMIFNNLYSESTMRDTVFSIPELDGYIAYQLPAEHFVVNNWTPDFGTGDQVWQGMGGEQYANTHFRSYLSFELPEIPFGYEIDSVMISIYQHSSWGNLNFMGEIEYDFPYWDVANGDTIKCIMSHINYGYELDSLDWEAGDRFHPYTFDHNIGIISDNSITGYKQLDITDCIISDYSNQRIYTQYRIAFQIDTDYDDMADQIIFLTSNWNGEERSPKIIFFYSESVNSHFIELFNDRIEYNIYPNPFNPQTTISYNLIESDDVRILIYNLKGQLVETLVDGYKSVGLHSVLWNAEKQPSGVYFYTVSSGDFKATGKCVLLK